MHRITFGFIVMALASLASGAPALTIDTFDVSQALMANAGSPTSVGLATGGSILGGERDALATHTMGPNDVDLVANPGGNGLLSLSTGADTLGSATLVYDGAGAAGLGGVDLTSNGALTGIALGIAFDDLAVDIAFTVMDVNAAVGSTMVSTSGGIFSPVQLVVLFASFSGGVDFTSVDSIEVEIRPLSPATDIEIDFIEAVDVPEPSPMLLIVTSGLAMAAFTRRRTAGNARLRPSSGRCSGRRAPMAGLAPIAVAASVAAGVAGAADPMKAGLPTEVYFELKTDEVCAENRVAVRGEVYEGLRLEATLVGGDADREVTMCHCPLNGCSWEVVVCAGYLNSPEGCAQCCQEGCGFALSHIDYCL